MKLAQSECMMLLCLAFCLAIVSIVVAQDNHALDRYVHDDDGMYNWRIVDIQDRENVTFYVLNMTSQQWFTAEHSDRWMWFHLLTIVVPKVPLQYPDRSFMFIDGGRQENGPPNVDDSPYLQFVAQFAVEVGALGAYLQQIPNQAIVFADDPEGKRRTEDDAIAWTWRQYIEDPGANPEILLQFPMTKGAKRALDCISEFSVSELGGSEITGFHVAGGSKRGWITWLIAAVDERVKGIGPISLSILNMKDNLHHHFRAYGGWSFTFQDYYNQNITQYLDTPRMDALARQVDPYEFRERLTMPKVIILACGDEFFLPDDPHYFYDELPEPKYMMMLDNTEHAVIGHYQRIYNSLKAMFLTEATNARWPSFTWTRTETETGGTITATLGETPTMIRSWSADTLSSTQRDYRLVTGRFPFINPVLWYQAPVEDLGGNQYRATFDNAGPEWKGFFIEAHFPGPQGSHFEVTTEVNIIPDTFPFPQCEGDECIGTIL